MRQGPRALVQVPLPLLRLAGLAERFGIGHAAALVELCFELAAALFTLLEPFLWRWVSACGLFGWGGGWLG